MKRTFRFLRTYYVFWLTLTVIIIGLGLQATNVHTAVHWLLGSTVLIMVFPILNDMWQDLRTGRYGVNILGVTAIFSSVLLHQYWAAVVTVVMLAGSKMLIDYADQRAKHELNILLAHAPRQAHILRARKIFDVRAHDVKAGEQVVIQPGELVPVDAVIIEGSAHFDEVLLTGDSLPPAKEAGEHILSGTTNLDGVITATAIHAAKDSQYERVVRMLRNAALTQSPFMRLADRYTIPFTATAFIIAIVSGIIGHGAIRFLEVIVVATPAPLLFAAPLALTAGMSRASKYGIIARTGSAFEKLCEAQTFVSNKNGTLTYGQPQVAAVDTYSKHTKAEVLGLAASLEQSSSHALARAIMRAATAKKLKLMKAKHITETVGQGLSAMVQSNKILVGRLSFLTEHDVQLPAKFSPKSIKQTAVFVAIHGGLAGAITFEDTARSGSKALFRTLQKLGIKHTAMITGDTVAASRTLAKQLAIDETFADMLAADKLDAIEHLVRRPVVCVGNGIDDAPLLNAADVGIALAASNNTTASESADVIIMHDDVSRVALAVEISKRTFAIARQTILAGSALTVALMIIFASGAFSPLIGTLVQELVVIFVICNALRARLNSPKGGN